MSQDDASETPLDILQDNSLVRLLLASYRQIKRINTEEFVPLIPSFGLILYSFGMLLMLILIAATFAHQALSDGLTLSDANSAGIPIFLGLVILYYITYQIASQVNILTDANEEGEEGTKEGIIGAYRASTLVFLGLVFWGIGFLLRIYIVPGINVDVFYNMVWDDTANAVGFFVYSFSVDLIYIGMVLIGAGMAARGLYRLYDLRTA